MTQSLGASNVLAFDREKPSEIRVLIVEDEMLIALGVTDIVDALGASWVTVSRVDTALAHIADQPFDAAIVDINLGGQLSDAVMDALGARGIPFVITTGYCADAITDKFRNLPRLTKPYMRSELEGALLRLIKSKAFALSA